MLELFNSWLTLVGRGTVLPNGNGREVHLAEVPSMKVNGYCQETNEIFEYLGCFWHGCPVMTNRHKPIGNTTGTLLSRQEETKARMQKIRDDGYNVFFSFGV